MVFDLGSLRGHETPVRDDCIGFVLFEGDSIYDGVGDGAFRGDAADLPPIITEANVVDVRGAGRDRPIVHCAAGRADTDSR